MNCDHLNDDFNFCDEPASYILCYSITDIVDDEDPNLMIALCARHSDETSGYDALLPLLLSLS